MQTTQQIRRNFVEDQHQELSYKHGEIQAWRSSWEEYNEQRDKWESKRRIHCFLKRPGLFLNLGECNDGSPFSAVAQAVNEAKWLVDYEIERELDAKLKNRGYKPEELFYLNSLKIWERVEQKEKLYEKQN